MDSLLNYNQLQRTAADTNEGSEDRSKADLAERQQKILDFTAPFENVAMDSSYDLIKDATKKMLKKAGVPVEKAAGYVKAFKSGGATGVMEELGKDRPSIFRNGEDITNKITELSKPTQKLKTRISDMLPEDFNMKEDKIQDRLQDKFLRMNDEDQEKVTKLLNERGATEKEMPDSSLRDQFNTSQAERSINEVNSGKNIPVSINQIKDEDFSDARPLMENSFKTEVDNLHPVYRAKFNELMDKRVALESDIPNEVSRAKFNLHQTERTLGDLTKFKPVTTDEISSVAESGIKAGEGSVLSGLGESGVGAAADLALGRATGQSYKQIGRQEGISQAQQQVTGQVTQRISTSLGVDGAKGAVATAEKVGEKGALKVAGEEAGEDLATSVAAGGGPEDPVGDVIGLAVGLGTFLGGLFGSRHQHQSGVQKISNAFNPGA